MPVTIEVADPADPSSNSRSSWDPGWQRMGLRPVVMREESKRAVGLLREKMPKGVFRGDTRLIGRRESAGMLSIDRR